MAKMKITKLTEKTDDEEILLRLKSLGVKIKDKHTAEAGGEEEKEKSATAGETVIEKRVASTVIRRRVYTPPPAAQPPPAAKDEEKGEEPSVKTTEEHPVKETKKEKIQVKKEKEPGPEKEKQPVAKPKKAPKKESKKAVLQPRVAEEAAEETVQKEIKPEVTVTPPEAPAEEGKEKLITFKKEDLFKGEMEVIGEGKEKEITKVLEEAYKQELDKGVVLGEEEEERKKKKPEKTLSQIEEQEAEEAKQRKKGVLKRKVVIKEEDLYTFKKGKSRAVPGRRDRRDRADESRAREEKEQEVRAAKKSIKVGNEISVGEFAKRIGVKAQEVIMKLLNLGMVSSINQNIDFDTAYLLGTDFGFEVEKVLSIEEDFLAREEEQKDTEESLKPRSPVVTIMGHVDHGKTLLLDTIRDTNVAEREAGGITQHIGAYKVHVEGKEIVFIDTPGHEAFTSMRARGALVTDIVILVVAADDGVMPQTLEAVNHARSANVPIIVAVNKIDKQNANPDKVMKDLSNLGLIPEEWGGSTLFAKISAKKKQGIEELLELIILQAELLELKANPDKLAKGIIIESRLDKGHGPVGTVIVQEGTLKIHDPFIAGSMFGRVRAMIDDKGKRIQEAPPSTPLLVVGFQEVPEGGDAFIVTTEQRYAKELSKYRQEKLKEQEQLKSSRTSLEDFYSRIGGSEHATLNVIVKGDVGGTIEAISEALKRLSTELVDVQIVHSGAGAITETDVNLAIATGSILIGFNVKPVGKAQAYAEHENIEIRLYTVIYDLIDEVKKAMEGLLAPKIKEVHIGSAEVRKTFSVSRVGMIAGSYVTEGKVTRNALARVVRGGEALFDGKLSSLKRFKDDAREVVAGYECGISLEGFNDIREGDVLEFYIEEKEAQTLDG